MIRLYITLFVLFFVSCTKLDVFDPVNTRDPNNRHFLSPPSSVEIDSYDDRELIISFEPSSADTIILYRQVDNDTSIFSFEINEFSSSIIDSSNIILDQEYNYDLWCTKVLLNISLHVRRTTTIILVTTIILGELWAVFFSRKKRK